MKIRIIASGEIRHIDNSTGSALVSAGLAEALSNPDDKPGRLPKYGDARPAEPLWEVSVVKGSARNELAILMTILGQTHQFQGDPDTANAKVTWDGGFRYVNGLGREIPEEILRQYRKAWKSNLDIRPVAGFNPEAQAHFSSKVNEDQASDLAARPR
jgi:hypothetical protein